MSREHAPDAPANSEETIRAAGQIVKYSREIYNLESVEDVATITLEAVSHVIDGQPGAAVVERQSSGLQVLESLIPGVEAGGDPPEIVTSAYEDRQILLCADEDVTVTYNGDDVTRVAPGEEPVHAGGVTVAAPTVYTDEMGDSGAVLLVSWDSLGTVEEHHVKPVDYLAEHLATAIVNIRSRERLERARNDLAKRKEMIEVYERLLRHDLGNDLQVITGFSEALIGMLGDSPQARQHAERILQTSKSAGELIETVGDTVNTLQQQGQAEPRDLRSVLTPAVDDVDTRFESMTVEYDPTAFEYCVYAGDLVDSVFTNILSNAAVHNEKPVTVHLSAAEPAPESVTVSIADDGAGIADEVGEELFEMGKKGPESSGTGFGLGLARTLVESYGGRIDVGESDRGGAEFRVTLERVR